MTMKKSETTISIYRTETSKWADPWGNTHPAGQVTEHVTVTKTGNTYIPRETGYGAVEDNEWIDNQGRTYREAINTLDYHATKKTRPFRRDSDNAVFHRLEYFNRIIDQKGNPITKD